MGLADRGGGSGLVGARWADVSAAWSRSWIGRPVPSANTAERYVVDRVVRLDDVPRIAHLASKRGLQNPDLLFVGEVDGRRVIQAADAKFSVETARSKQVSAGVVEALMGLGPIVRSLVGELDEPCAFLPGFFLSPDYALTHLTMGGRHGIMRATVRADEVALVPVEPGGFFAPLEAAGAMPTLAAIDALPVRIEESLLAGLYYFRLARAAVGCWLDAVRPLLLLNDKVAVNEGAVLAEVERRAPGSRSAFDLILTMNGDVDVVRAQRRAVEQVAGLPLLSRDLRALTEAAMHGREGDPPSANQVRRRVGAWFRGELRAAVGPLNPPVPDLPNRLRELGMLSRELAPRLPGEVRRIVDELLAERAAPGADVDAPVAGERSAVA